MKKHDQYPGGPAAPGRGEKPKDLIGTWKKLLAYCRKYLPVLILALICAVGSTVLTLAGPDKLSDMTDTITEGVSPDIEKLQQIGTAVTEQISSNTQSLIEAITGPLTDQEAFSQKTMQILSSQELTREEKLAFQQALAQMEQQGLEALLDLPEGVLQILFSPVEVRDVTLSWSDQVQTLAALTGEAPDLEALPETALSLIYTDLSFEGATISGSDQQSLTALMAGLDPADEAAALDVIDHLPASVYDLVMTGIDMDRIVDIGTLLICFYVLSFLLSVIQNWSMASVTQRVSKTMRSDISRKINRLPIGYYDRTTTGDVLSRVTNDVDTIGQSLNQSIGSLVHAVVLLLGSLLMMLITNVTLTVTAVLATAIGFVFMFAIMGRSQKYFVRQQSCLGRVNGYIEEIYSGQTVVKAYNGEDNARKTFEEMNGQLRSAGFKAQCLSGLMQPLMTFIGNFGYMAVCVVGGALALEGKIKFGVIVAFIMYVRYFTQPLSQIAQSMQMLQSAAAAGERVFAFLEAQEMADESHKTKKLENVQGYVDFDHVKFGYEGSGRIIIHDFSAAAKPGQKIAIVGPTGAGKTTLVNLLMRFHEIQGGQIRIDGVPTQELRREDVHAQFCMVLQDTWLFEGTVRENLVYSTPNVSDEKVQEACRAVGLDHFIRTLPHGYDTVLNDQVSLSQGQKQQLTIARAMIADRPMLILDEATSSVDTRTEQKIQEAMDKLMEDRTSFVIAHRLSTIKNSDLILVLKDGDIIESGTHNALLEKGGFYAELYNSQFEQGEESA